MILLCCPAHPRYKAKGRARRVCFCCDAIYQAASTVRGYTHLLESRKDKSK